MLTYKAQKNIETPSTTEKPWLLLLLAFVWLWPGIFGHDPWKPNEPYVNAIAQYLSNGGNWIFPVAHGITHLKSAPLYYWVAAVFAKLLSPWLLEIHDAARLATPFFMSITLFCAGYAGRLLIGRRHGRSVVLILIGSIGLIVFAHQMTPEIANLAGFAIAMLSLSMSMHQPGKAGALLALSLVVLSLSSNLLNPISILMVSILLPAFSTWRNKNHLISLLLALSIALPLMFIWPHLFAKTKPQEFSYWWHNYAFGALQNFRLINFAQSILYYSMLVFWFCWPAWPLAAWALYRRKSLGEPMLQLPILMLIISIIMLSIAKDHSAESALPLLLPMSMLAALELDSLKRGAAALLNWFGLMTFGFFGLFIWFGWLAMNFGWPSELAERSTYFSPYYQAQVSIFYVVCAMLACGFWIWAVTRNNLSGRQAITNWAAGVTLFCGLSMTLWLPWLDAAKSFRPVVDNMMAHIPKDLKQNLANKNACIATKNDDSTTLINWQYYANLQLKTYKKWDSVPCQWLLLSFSKQQKFDDSSWQLIWQGHRPRDSSNIYHLYKHKNMPVLQINWAGH